MDLKDLGGMNLSQIASIIRRDWGSKVHFSARPYLEAMGCLDNISDNYAADSGKSVVTYFLCNASTWRGPVAKEIKKELKKRAGLK